MRAQLVLLLATLWLKRAASEPRLDRKKEENIDKIENLVQYEYQYGVDESHSKGPVMNRWERRLGEYVKGAYSVMEPDGSIRTVDYEVDGENGYHAIIRLNPPVLSLLSYQQLTQSNELFPEATISTYTSHATSIRPDPDVNHHAKAPYLNNAGFKDQKTAATNNVATIVPGKQLPPSPANYNVPQIQNLIYHKTPFYQAKNKYPVKPTKQTWLSYPRSSGITQISLKPVKATNFGRNQIDESSKPTKKYSRLVKRFNSFAEALQ